MSYSTLQRRGLAFAGSASSPKPEVHREPLPCTPPPPPCESNTEILKLGGNNTQRCSDKRGGVLLKGKVGHGSKSCGNNTYRCFDNGVALATAGGGGGGAIRARKDRRRYENLPCKLCRSVGTKENFAIPTEDTMTPDEGLPGYRPPFGRHATPPLASGVPRMTTETQLEWDGRENLLFQVSVTIFMVLLVG